MWEESESISHAGDEREKSTVRTIENAEILFSLRDGGVHVKMCGARSGHQTTCEYL